MSSPSIPTADQLAAARLAHWHQNADPIQTINMLRDWLNMAGLVLFTPRAGQLPAPAPSFVEAVLGVPNAAPTMADTDQTRSLLTRLLLDGGAVPLNLLGSPAGMGSETPDFLVSPLAFPYLFTLRGDKAWKQPPATSGANKVSPLALNAYTLLTEYAKDHAAGMSAYDLTTQLGKEVTETAVLRALTELWQHLRVLPVPQLDGAATVWELTTARFTKQMKTGANAGQPTALSALISLYLGQAIVASEEEIETFLSPVASRSRIRDVVHALTSARQLQTIAVEGRTVLHVEDALPAFLGTEAAAVEESGTAEVAEGSDAVGDGARITKFIPKPQKTGTGFVTKPGRSPGGGAGARERRPFTRESNRADRPSFSKPWEEEKADRLDAARMPSRPADGGDADNAEAPARGEERKSGYEGRPAGEGTRGFGGKPGFGSKPGFGAKPSFGGKPSFGARSGFGSKPRSGGDRPEFGRARESSEARPPRREFTPRGDAQQGNDGGERPRKTFSKPGTFGRKREGFAGKPSFSRDGDARPPRRDGDARPPRRDNDARPPRRDFGDSRPPRREFTPRPDREQGDSRAPRRTFGDRPDKPSFGGGRQGGSFSARPPRKFEGGAESARPGGKPGFSRDREERAPRAGGFSGGRAEGRSEGRGGRPSGPPFRKFDAPRTPRASYSERPPRPEGSGEFAPRPSGYMGKPGGSGVKKPFGKSAGGYAGKASGGSFAGKSGSSFGGKKPYGASSGARAGGAPGKPASTFDKFKGNKKPFGNRPPARKFKRKEEE
ncbi:MAG: hypothetical protein M3Y50_06255 [Acidobacteriota bacterium]|nr:hypothetical protein [Acidobacteriota bacterium]